jgi:hypothetical protein
MTKTQLTKTIKALDAEIRDLVHELLNQTPQPDGKVYLHGEPVTRQRIDSLIAERNQAWSERWMTKQQIAGKLDKANRQFNFSAEQGMTSYKNYTREQLLAIAKLFEVKL